MKVDEVLRLIDAGFTADEVRAMSGPQTQQEKPAEEKPDEQEKPAEEKPEEQEKPAEKPAMSADDVRTIVAEQLKAALQKANARSAERTAGADKPKTAQDIIKELTKNM